MIFQPCICCIKMLSQNFIYPNIYVYTVCLCGWTKYQIMIKVFMRRTLIRILYEFFWLLLLYTILMALNIIFGLFSSWNGRRRDRIQNLWRFLDCCKHCFSEWAKNMNSIFHPIYNTYIIDTSKSRTLVLFLLNFLSFRPSILILLWKRF